jgi:chaperonin GroEL (HSP60 family)
VVTICCFFPDFLLCLRSQNIASISAGNDDTIGEMIADALDKVGSNGVLSIESSNSIDTVVDVTEGMEIDRGYISPQFVNNQERLLVEYDSCRWGRQLL